MNLNWMFKIDLVTGDIRLRLLARLLWFKKIKIADFAALFGPLQADFDEVDRMLRLYGEHNIDEKTGSRITGGVITQCGGNEIYAAIQVLGAHKFKWWQFRAKRRAAAEFQEDQ